MRSIVMLKVFGRGVGRTFLQKGFPTASEETSSEKLLPPINPRPSIRRVSTFA